MTDGNDGSEAGRDDETIDPLAAHSDDAPPPASPARRGIAAIIAFVLIAIIVTFLVWFVATHTERRTSVPANADEARAAGPPLPPGVLGSAREGGQSARPPAPAGVPRSLPESAREAVT